ncbi:MAG: hypothetical protein OEN01_14485 [Candidatus Krumholzibacteria bacterium]|nr:hypothetical protein [Candidatus Krumholzibacteria bacterium]
MKLPRFATSVVFSLVVLLLPTAELLADPILKPKKYHGPIPKRSLALALGFIAGPDNEEMYGFLDRQIAQPLLSQLRTDDFESSLAIDAIYTHKLHPNFAFRGKTGVAFLRSTSKGNVVASEPDTSGLAPLLEFKRDFDVYLFSLEASGLYYFQDASVSEFQTYFGGGFSFFFPLAQWQESTVNTETGQPFSNVDESEFSAEPGVHGVLGALYHVRNTTALFLEGRYQIGQSKFALDLPTQTAGIQRINFDVEYTGFLLTVGYARFF